MYISPGIYFGRVCLGHLVYDGVGWHSIGFIEAKSKIFVVTCFGQEFEVNLLENKVKRLEEGRSVEERNIIEVSNSGVSFEPFKLI